MGVKKKTIHIVIKNQLKIHEVGLDRSNATKFLDLKKDCGIAKRIIFGKNQLFKGKVSSRVYL